MVQAIICSVIVYFNMVIPFALLSKSTCLVKKSFKKFLICSIIRSTL